MLKPTIKKLDKNSTDSSGDVDNSITTHSVQKTEQGTEIRLYTNDFCDAVFKYDAQDNLMTSTFSKREGKDLYSDKYEYNRDNICTKIIHTKNRQIIGQIIESHPNGQIKSISATYLYDSRFSHYDGNADPAHRIADGIAREFDDNGNELIDKSIIYIRGKPINSLVKTEEQLALLAQFMELKGYQVTAPIKPTGLEPQ